MNIKIQVWIPIILVTVGLTFAYLILFRDVFKKIGEEPRDTVWPSRSIRQNSNGFIPAAYSTTGTNVQPPVRSDTVTGATPRIIAWINDVVQQVKPAVVGICVGDNTTPPPWQQGWTIFTPSGRRSVGTGVIVNPKGYVITNYHVVSLTGDISVSVFSSQGYKDYPAEIVAGNKKADLALLKILLGGTFPFAVVGNSDGASPGDKVIAIGNPFGLTQTVTAGIISAKRKSLVIGNVRMHNLFQTDVPINQGNSGGPLCNMKGEVIGINTAIYSPVEAIYTGVSFAIPINRAKKLFDVNVDFNVKPVNFWFTRNPIPRKPNPIQPSPGEGIEEIAWLGIDFVPGNDINTQASEVAVDEIEGISPMEAGLQAGDIVKSINGCPTPNIYALKEAIKKVPLKAGQGVVMDVYNPWDNKSRYVSFRLKKFDLQGR
jgi:S1-C subfamily serine protease